MGQEPQTERSPTARSARAFSVRIGPAARFSRAAALVALAAAVGCTGRRDCLPVACPELAACAPDAVPTADANGIIRLAERLKAAPGEGLCGRRYQILALSGGGKYGAFSAGVLAGWADRGDRPVFDVVTGVSVGALVAVYAFLGTEYDAKLRPDFSDFTTRDILRPALLRAPFTGAIASSRPLKNRIARLAPDAVVDAVAAAHRAGRRLYVGTTNLDTKRLTIWDLGAIAAGDRPDRYDQFRTVLLASAAVPGEFPPVPIEVTVDGKTYTELHVDGGVSAEIFVRVSLLDLPPEQLKRDRPLAGSTIHVLVAGKLYADPTCVRPRLAAVVAGAVGSLINAMTANDLIRIYTLSLLTGMDYRFAALRQDYEDDNRPLNFEPASLGKLFDEGYRVGRTGDGWRSDPPGFRPSEQVVPRTGTDFRPAGRR